MYRIGEFSKKTDIPVRTLRFYDEMGVLKPNETDKFTGYRYYDEQNVSESEFIKLLKSVDFTLEEIVLYKSSITEDILDKKQLEIEQKIKELKNKYRRILIMKQELNEMNSEKQKIKVKQ